MQRRLLDAALAVSAGLFLGGCGKDEPSAARGGDASAAAVTAPSTSAESTPKTPPPEDRPPTITVDDTRVTVDGSSFTGAPADWGPRLADLLGQKPKVAGEPVVVIVMRDTKTPRVEAALAALTHAHAKTAVVRTPRRDQSNGELSLALARPTVPDCAVVAMIEKDSAVAVWSKGGAGAQRFARGMAGPDLTSSTEALRKRAATCDAPTWFVGAADTVSWGLVFDLALQARGGPDAGSTLRPTETVLIGRAPVPGKKLAED